MSGSGAIDNEFDESERSTRDQLEANLLKNVGLQHARMDVGDVAIDLVTRQALLIVDQPAESVVEYYEEEDFDLLNYKQHPYLPVRPDDPVFTCVFIGGVDDLHSFSSTYDYPAGRLARVPTEIATGGEN